MTAVSKSSDISAQTRISDGRTAGVLFIFGASLFLLFTTAAEAIYPNFSLKTNAISDLAAIGVKTTVLEETAIFILGLTWSLGAYYLFRRTGRKGMMTLNVLPGVGFLIAGLSPENVNVVIHSIGTIAFPLGAIVAVLSYRMIASPLRYFSAVLGTISLVSTFFIFAGYRVVCGTCGYQEGMNSLQFGLGGLESMIIYPIIIWLIAFGSYLMAENKT